MQYHEYIRFTSFGTLFIFISFMITPVLSPYIKSLGFDDFQIGLIFSFYPLAIIIFSPIMGKLSDSIGRKAVIFLGVLLQMTAIAMYIIDGSGLFLAAARMVNAVGYVTVILTVLARIEDIVDGKRRGKYVGFTLTIENVSRMTGPLIGGIVADMFFTTAPFYLSIILLAVLSLYFLKDRPEKPRKLRISEINPVKGLKEFLSDRRLRSIGLLGVVMHASMPATTVFLPLLLIERFGVSYSYIGAAFFVMSAAHLVEFYFGRICDSAGRAKVLYPGTALFGLSMLLVSMAWSYETVLVFLFLIGIGGSMWDIAAWSLMSDIGESLKKEGQVVMSYASVSKMGSFASWILSGIVALYSIELLFAISGTAILVGTLVSYLILRSAGSESSEREKGMG